MSFGLLEESLFSGLCAILISSLLVQRIGLISLLFLICAGGAFEQGLWPVISPTVLLLTFPQVSLPGGGSALSNKNRFGFIDGEKFKTVKKKHAKVKGEKTPWGIFLDRMFFTLPPGKSVPLLLVEAGCQVEVHFAGGYHRRNGGKCVHCTLYATLYVGLTTSIVLENVIWKRIQNVFLVT